MELVGGENYSRGSSSRKEGEGPGDERSQCWVKNFDFSLF